MIKTFVKALVPLLTACASAGLAWCLLQGSAAVVAVTAVGVLAIAFFSAAFSFGEMSLPSDPERALTLMEWQRASYWITSAVGAALVIRVGLLFPSDLKGDAKELVGALSSGATAFITAMFAVVGDDKADETLAGRIKSAFQARYLRPGMTPVPTDLVVHRFKPGSRGERLVHAARFEDVSGWDRPSRRKRATGLAAELKSGASNP